MYISRLPVVYFINSSPDYGYDRLRRHGMKRVSTEIMLNALGMTIAKLFRFYETGAAPDYWQAPPGLGPQEFKKPSAKRLSKKGKKIHERTYKQKEHAKHVEKPNPHEKKAVN